MKIVLASNNPHKLHELQALLAGLGHTLVAQGELGIPEAEEPHATFIENALAKARHAAAASGLPALADDSGLCVAALGGAPGVVSARYAQLAQVDVLAPSVAASIANGPLAGASRAQHDAANNALLLARMQGVADRRAHFTAVLVAVHSPGDPEPLVAEGRLHGEVMHAPQGEGGFGYDPLLWMPQQRCTVAQLSASAKNRISHRAQAAQHLLALLRANWG